MAAFSDYTLAELKEFRKELAKAIATGAMSIRFSDREIRYKSLREMKATLAMLDEAIADEEGTNPLRQIRINSEKGFRC